MQKLYFYDKKRYRQFWKEKNVNFKKKNTLYWFIPKSIIICMSELGAFIYIYARKNNIEDMLDFFP